jgi:carbonic anhydrase
MPTIQDLFKNNREWADEMRGKDPEFFSKLKDAQKPEVLWIGCADSRVPANQIIKLMPGEVFVHRNIANVVVHTDVNCLSVMQYAVQVLKVKCIIVCGHYGCGGVAAAMTTKPYGLIDGWLRHIKDVVVRHQQELDGLPDDAARFSRMCELNVMAQVANVCASTIVQGAWKNGQKLSVHGVCYALDDGLLKDLDVCVEGPEQVPALYRMDV